MNLLWNYASKISCIGLFVFSLLIFPRSAFAASYYVSSSGSDGNGGTLSSPWKTIQHAVDTISAGDTVTVRSGVYAESVALNKSGTAGAPITLTNYSGETVVINGGGNNALYANTARGAISYWTINGITFRSTNRYTILLGWWGESQTDHFIIKNNKIYGSLFAIGSYHLFEGNDSDGTGYTGNDGDAGLSDAGTSHHNTFRNNTVHDFTRVDARGIWTQGLTHDNIIEGNTVTNIMTNSGLGQCIDLDGASNVEWRHVVRNNSVRNCSYVGIQLENVFDSVIENNRIEDSGSAGIIIINYDNGAGCKQGGENGQYGDQNGDNNCQGGNTNVIFRQNVIWTSTNWGWGYGGIMNWYAGGVKIWGNTIFSNGAAGNGGINFQGTLAQTGGASIKNNIITQGNGVAICAMDFASFSEDRNNLLYRTNNDNVYTRGSGCNSDMTLASYQTSTGKGQGSISGNPQFVNAGGKDFRLNSNSPAINAGVDIGSTRDFVGATRPIGVMDIGAYEFGGTPANTPTNTPSSTPRPPTSTPVISKTPTSTPSYVTSTHTPTPTAPTNVTTSYTPTPSPKGNKPTIPGDANGDNVVSGVDYVTWLVNEEKKTTNGASEGDFDKNGKVDLTDFFVWMNNYRTKL